VIGGGKQAILTIGVLPILTHPLNIIFNRLRETLININTLNRDNQSKFDNLTPTKDGSVVPMVEGAPPPSLETTNIKPLQINGAPNAEAEKRLQRSGP
jgi:hypothetical protein